MEDVKVLMTITAVQTIKKEKKKIKSKRKIQDI